MNKYIVLSMCFVLTGCFSGETAKLEKPHPSVWTATDSQLVKQVEAASLKEWWKKFNDPVLNNLVETALTHSPDRRIAEARIAEARGLQRYSKSFLLPQLGVSGSTGYSDNGANNSSSDNFYDAQFDASFEIDVFGKNRSNLSASDASLQSVQESYHDVTLTLIADIARSYIDYRAAQKQTEIAGKNLKSQEKTLKLVLDLYRLGEGGRLDVERARNLVNTTRASLPEFTRQAENARLRLSILTGKLPEELVKMVNEAAPIPDSNIQPFLLAPAHVIALRPDIKAASANLVSRTSLAKAAVAEVFPTFSLSSFYGVTDNALINASTPWNVALNSAVSLLNFGRLQGQIDAARSREVIAFEEYRKTLLAAVVEVETNLTDYAYINKRQVALANAYKSAAKALELSQSLYKEGEVSFLDVLDAQRSANNAEAAMVSATAAQAESLTRLFKSLGVY